MATAVNHASQSNSLTQLASETSRCRLTPRAFFVSWQGVLTVAYTGFPPALQNFKDRVNQAHPELPKENPGSKWPKTSLGALKDNKRLTPQDLETLNALCRTHSEELHNVYVHVLAERMSLIMYKQRSLERCIDCQDLQLSGPIHDAEPSIAQQANVTAVLGEADDPNYWISASKDGNRESHYRGVAIGATLVVKVNSDTMHCCSGHGDNLQIKHLISAFRTAVDNTLPGYYAWFDDESLHVTVRALVG